MPSPLRYTLYGDPFIDPTPMRTAYEMGRPWGQAGFRSGLPEFPDHATAIRFTIDRTYLMPPTPDHYTLTPADVTDLRTSIRTRVPDVQAATADAPCVRYNSAMDAYEVHTHGTVLCVSKRADVVLALLRAERWEPGFIRRILDPADPVDISLLDADAREKDRRARAAYAFLQRQRAEEADEARRADLRRSMAALAPADLTLDDLLAEPSPPRRTTPDNF